MAKMKAKHVYLTFAKNVSILTTFHAVCNIYVRPTDRPAHGIRSHSAAHKLRYRIPHALLKTVIDNFIGVAAAACEL